jgi:membrane fusion protein, copper/silver efflux system
MKNKSLTPLPALLAVALTCLGLLLVGCNKTSPETKTLYTCSMHPQIIQDHPGNCPICGMKLTPVRKQNDSGSNSAAININPATRQLMNLRTDLVTNGPLRRIVRSVGVVDFDETSLAEVTTRYKGWIEKLHVDSTGVQVHRGDPLFEIYSPELYSAQVEYLLALAQASRAGPDAGTLRTSARAKLRFFDLSDAQIEDLEKTKQAKKTLTIYSPRDGVVVEKGVIQGQMVEAGMKLYRLADLSLLWIVTQVYEQDLPLVKVGQDANVRLSYLTDREFRGRVTYIYPTLDEKTRTAKVRMEFHNPGYFLKPGMFATVEIRSEVAPSALLVPDVAVLRSGEKNTVFVALDDGHFEARTVTLGPRAENHMYQVLSGLINGERVVTSGQFLLDSESQLRLATEKMNGPDAKKSATPTASGTAEKSEVSMGTNAMVYICPMPEHVAIKYDHPGSCSICGMTLVPVAEQTLAKLHPGGRVEYYFCPMTDACPTPGHGSVHYEKPGKCPVCNMTLIPFMGEPPTSPAAPSPAPTSSNATNVSVKELVIPALYTCPMHLDVVSEKPGKCPNCGMDLMRTTEFDDGKIAEENWRKQHEH